MRFVDVLITTEEDTRVVFGVDRERRAGAQAPVDAASFEPVARALQDRFGFSAVAITLRENPGVWLNTWSAVVVAGGHRYDAPRYEVEIVDRIGAGDAFSAGFIVGHLVVGGWEAAVRYGAALSALKHSVSGDFSLSTREDVEQVLRGAALRVSR
jgi:2-dehydro-3-deoxygluconokinase